MYTWNRSGNSAVQGQWRLPTDHKVVQSLCRQFYQRRQYVGNFVVCSSTGSKVQHLLGGLSGHNAISMYKLPVILTQTFIHKSCCNSLWEYYIRLPSLASGPFPKLLTERAVTILVCLVFGKPFSVFIRICSCHCLHGVRGMLCREI